MPSYRITTSWSFVDRFSFKDDSSGHTRNEPSYLSSCCFRDAIPWKHNRPVPNQKPATQTEKFMPFVRQPERKLTDGNREGEGKREPRAAKGMQLYPV
ncbi:hypothetical protein PG985_016074 [Apiospora marii]|uniref:uncharacterized protein n=1 Tax=Apiospora marii TaxID=335849 RepID=UPI00312F9EBF